MSEQQLRLMERAQAKYGRIRPCAEKTALSECFTRDRGQVILWFNTSDNSTHVEMESRK